MATTTTTERKLPAPFLIKTYQLVDDPATDEVVSWNETGTTFVVWKTADFARDLLPNYFKHCNFSSFVRQLNTYGFRKIVADKWEFANENFRRGEQELLAQMRRRKTVSAAPNGKSTAVNNPTSPINSGDDQAGSSSTSSPDSKNPGSLDTPSATQLANLSDENEKLRKENQTLRSELTNMKKQCDELITYLTKYVNVGPDQINNIMIDKIINNSGSNRNGESGKLTLNKLNGQDNDDKFRDNVNLDESKDGDDKGLKIFGVVLKETNKKRGRDENNIDYEGGHRKDMKSSVDQHHKLGWLQISSDDGNKVCN